MVHYNPWPLGALPENWQRPEPQLIRDRGYSWHDPRDIVSIFESKLAKYSGSKFAVLVDCCTHAIFLSIKYLQHKEADPKVMPGASVVIPKNTYVSVPMQLIHAGLTPEFKDVVWSGAYELGSIGVIDGAGRFSEGMFDGSRDALHTLSFQIKKRLPIGRGGAILTDSEEAYNWLKLASYDGRDLNTPYDSIGHVSNVGYHFYMTPEDAARGIILMDQILDQLPAELEDTMSSENYPDLSKMAVFASKNAWKQV